MTNKYTIDTLNQLVKSLGGDGEAKYPINALNNISATLGGKGESKYPINALNEIISAIQGDDSDSEGLRSVLYDVLNGPVISTGWNMPRASLKKASAAQMLHTLMHEVKYNDDISKMEAGSITEELAAFLKYAVGIPFKLYDAEGVELPTSTRFVSPTRLGQIMYSPKYQNGYRIYNTLGGINNTVYYWVSYDAQSKIITAFKQDVRSSGSPDWIITRQLIKETLKVEFRAKEAVTLPTDGKMYNELVPCNAYYIPYVDGAPGTAVKLTSSPSLGDGYNIEGVDGLVAYKYNRVTKDTFNVSLFSKALTSDDPTTYAAGDVIGYLTVPTNLYSSLPADFI